MCCGSDEHAVRVVIVSIVPMLGVSKYRCTACHGSAYEIRVRSAKRIQSGSAKRIHSGSGYGASGGRGREGPRKVRAKEAWTDR